MTDEGFVARWDAEKPLNRWRAIAGWVAMHIGDPTDIFMIEFYQRGGRNIAMVHAYVNIDGKHTLEPGTLAPAKAEPKEVILTSMPPNNLLFDLPLGGGWLCRMCT